ncbi:hypothetical protein [Yinghuangia seranimata]|uniref:hypothetical protein n=1 Tax=Yinghuangia seranimata TaxID=408067 RepID=UPI00248ADD56|nr:hypothetical protein [Yinghuangia seranimata]MDI2129539.1 hypothetical protein [Yinghuangia seranimata]
MSAQEERGTRELQDVQPTALYDVVLGMLRDGPDGLPEQPTLPKPPESSGPSLSVDEVKAAVRDALDPMPDDVAALEGRLAELGGREARLVRLIRFAVAGLPVADEAAARAFGRRLARTGTTKPGVAVGLALLVRFGEAEDVACLAAFASVRDLTRLALEALDRVDPRTAGAVDLAMRLRGDELRPLTVALWNRDQEATAAELSVLPGSVDSHTARRIAEASLLPELLGQLPLSDSVLTAQAGKLLVRMGSTYDRSEVPSYREAAALYEAVVARSGALEPTLDHHAMLVSIALDLRSGPGVLVGWPPGRREALLATLTRLLAEPAWASAVTPDPDRPMDAPRADWILRTRQRLSEEPGPARDGLRFEVVVTDPGDRARVETRILVDGRPVVAEFFRQGPAYSPEHLLDGGELRADAEPREVCLAEASCTEGCCGALYVTIRRDGDTVVWDGWRRPNTSLVDLPAAPPPTLRFDAEAYDAELTRATDDRSWAWRARTVARLLKEQLTERPGLLSRWDTQLVWCGTVFDRPDTAAVTVRHAPGLGGREPAPDDDLLYFRWDVTDDGTPPEAQAAAALRRLADEDVKASAVVCGGRRERAEELGYTWPGR